MTKTPNNFEEKLKEELENFYIDLIGGCPEKKDYYFIKKSVKAISTLCEDEVKRARVEGALQEQQRELSINLKRLRTVEPPNPRPDTVWYNQ